MPVGADDRGDIPYRRSYNWSPICYVKILFLFVFFFYFNFKIMKGGLQLMRMSVGGCTLEVRGFERINLSLS